MYTLEQAKDVAQMGEKIFLKRNREILASFPAGQGQVLKALTAWTRLHSQEKILEHVTSSDPGDFGFFASHLEEVFLALYDQGKLQPDSPITDLGQAALDAMRKRTGVYADGEAPASSSQPLSAQEQLEAEVIADFNGGLSADTMRGKRNASKAYNDTFIRLANGNRLESRVTYSGIVGA